MTTDDGHAGSRDPAGVGNAGASAEFEHYMSQVFDRAWRLTRDRDRSMDIVQDVFLKWNRQCEIATPERPEAWLRTVTTRRVFELARTPACRLVRADEIADAVESARDASLSGPDRDLLHDDVMRALSRLSDMQRDVLLAKTMDARSFASIATEMGLSESTIKTHYLRAVRSLRDALSPRWRDES